jgi:integrase
VKRAKWKLDPNAAIDDGRFKDILDAAKKDKRIHLALMIAGNMGWRVGEIVHVRVTDVDLRTATVRKWVLKKRGTGTAPTYVQKPIAGVVMPELERWIGTRRDGWLFPSVYGKQCDVFTRPKDKGKCLGCHVTKRTFQNGFKHFSSAAGVPEVHGRGIHSLRHCFAFRVAEKTKDPHKVRDMLDHEGIEVAALYVQTADQKKILEDIGGVS